MTLLLQQVCMYVCVCVRERGKKEEKRWRNRVERLKAEMLWTVPKDMSCSFIFSMTLKIFHNQLRFNKGSDELEKIDSSCSSSSSQVEILCPLWNSEHRLQQCFLRSAVNPHWYQIKLWQISCSGHHNSSLAILSCLCYRSYPIPVWPYSHPHAQASAQHPHPTYTLLDDVSDTHTK